MKKLLNKLKTKRSNREGIRRYCEIEFGSDATSAYNMILAGYGIDKVAGQLR